MNLSFKQDSFSWGIDDSMGTLTWLIQEGLSSNYFENKAERRRRKKIIVFSWSVNSLFSKVKRKRRPEEFSKLIKIIQWKFVTNLLRKWGFLFLKNHFSARNREKKYFLCVFSEADGCWYHLYWGPISLE